MVQCIVMIVRKRYASPYRRYKYFTIEAKDLKSKASFIKLIEERAKHWRDGEYFLLEDDRGVLARFDIKEGKVTLLYRNSPATDQEYPCWELFRA